MVVQGFPEDCLALDGADFKYNSDAVFDLILLQVDGTPGDVMLLSTSIVYTYLQSDMFSSNMPPRYLKVRDPVSGNVRYFSSTGYCTVQDLLQSTGNRHCAHSWWHRVLSRVRTSHVLSITVNEKLRKNQVLSCTDDLLARVSRNNADWFYQELNKPFECKDPQWLELGKLLDHTGDFPD